VECATRRVEDAEKCINPSSWCPNFRSSCDFKNLTTLSRYVMFGNACTNSPEMPLILYKFVNLCILQAKWENFWLFASMAGGCYLPRRDSCLDMLHHILHSEQLIRALPTFRLPCALWLKVLTPLKLQIKNWLPCSQYPHLTSVSLPIAL
jgi:hypothetical protein